jgi:uncharacterized protein YlxP (DUF503 family)
VGDLKGKRKQVASLKAQLHGRLGAAVAEVEHQDRWQRATLSVALTGGSLAELERATDRVERFVCDRHPEGTWFERRIASSNDFEALA